MLLLLYCIIYKKFKMKHFVEIFLLIVSNETE